MARKAIGVKKRADGTLEKRFTIDGKRYSIYGKTQKELNTKELEFRKQIETGLYSENRNITLDKYYEEWLKGKRNSTKSNSLKTYSSCYKNHISPRLGKRKVQAIERREVLNLQRDISKRLSATSCNMVLRVLTIILNDAVRDEIIIKNPAAGIKAIKEPKKASETYHRALTEEEQKVFMQELKDDFYYEFIAVLLCSGMRYGEVGALTWKDIDFKNNVIHVTKTLTYTEDSKVVVGETPKSEAGRRDIPLTNVLKDLFLSQRQKLKGVFPMGNTNVFVSVYGGFVLNHAVNGAIENALKRLEEKGIHIEHFTAHALRDTFATRYIEQGGQPQTLKTILGHSSLTMTMDLYAHVLPNTKQEEMEKLHIAL